MGKIIIDPLNRIEGHIGVEANTVGAESNGVRVQSAYIKGNLFRGFERIMIGRDPRDAMVICQRICGVCPGDHATAASQNIGTLYGYKVHHEDPVNPWVSQASTPLPQNAARLRNLMHAAQHLMSHILHFYHLVALDYVNPNVLLGGVPTQLKRPFLCPRYDDNYYITTARINALAGTLPPAAVAKLATLPGWGVDPGGAVNAYLTGQYLKALDIRRICHEMYAIFGGRGPHGSGFTPGGVTATANQASVTKYQNLLNQVLAFIGLPTDFANGVAGTLMFDVVAAAHLFPEYFWIGNAYGHFLSNGWAENGFKPGISNFLGQPPGTDNRGFRRGYKLSAQQGVPLNPINITKIGESIAGSRYKPYPGGGLPDPNFRHPWNGATEPDPDGSLGSTGYSWLKSPRYDIGTNDWTVFEVGPLARQVVEGNYYAGVLNALGYGATPVWGQPGPDISNPAHPLFPIYAALPPANGGPNLSGVAYNGDSTLDRIAARAVETLLFGLIAQQYLNDLQGTIGGDGYGPSGCTDRFGENVPVSSSTYRGYGMTEASRGALSHWIALQNGKTTLYQCVVPTTWNASPRDANGNPGPAEKSLEGNNLNTNVWIADANQPIEVIRALHSYDFCIACAVHVITPKGEVHKVDVPALP
jgi:hydrogenase large subunit